MSRMPGIGVQSYHPAAAGSGSEPARSDHRARRHDGHHDAGSTTSDTSTGSDSAKDGEGDDSGDGNPDGTQDLPSQAYYTEDYAATNPWYRRRHEEPTFGLAQSIPHVTRQEQKREEKKADSDVEAGGTTDGAQTAHRYPSKDSEAQRQKEEQLEREREWDRYRNVWSKFRSRYRIVLAEFLSVIVTSYLITTGLIIYKLYPTSVTFETKTWSFGLATMAGIYIAGGVSGSHINPVISILLAFYRGLPRNQLKWYFLAQVAGPLVGAIFAYLTYRDNINQLDPEYQTSGVAFYSSPNSQISKSNVLFSEFMAATAQATVIFALGDDQNSPPGAGMNALIIGLVTTMLGMTVGYNTGPILNPCRDLMQRIVAYLLGYKSAFEQGWWVAGCMGMDLVGGIVGAFIYDFFIFVGSESPVNFLYPNHNQLIRKLRGTGGHGPMEPRPGNPRPPPSA